MFLKLPSFSELAGYRQPDWKQAHKEQKPFTLYVAGAPEGEKAVQEAAVLAVAVHALHAGGLLEAVSAGVEGHALTHQDDGPRVRRRGRRPSRRPLFWPRPSALPGT